MAFIVAFVVARTGDPKAERTLVHAAKESLSRFPGWARRQGALSWEIRTAARIPRPRRDASRETDPCDLPTIIQAQFLDGSKRSHRAGARHRPEWLSTIRRIDVTPQRTPKAQALL
jgi:hypothetical protein